MTAMPPAQNQLQLVLTGILEHTLASLELTKDQHAEIEVTYKACGAHLIAGLGYSPSLGQIFAQGSMRLGSVIRPFRDITEHFDLDVVFHLMLACGTQSPEKLLEAVGHHLRQKYKDKVQPLAKGWCLDFTQEGDYFLDVIPSMISPLGGNVIAIADSNRWKDSNPRDYATLFEDIASKAPRFENETMLKEGIMLANSAHIEPLPEHTLLKSPLQRIVQVSKRYRDYYFNKKVKKPDFLPASIVITTLLSNAYDRIVWSRPFSSGFDLLMTCVVEMVNHLEMRRDQAGKDHHWLSNPSLPSENLVEKWRDPRYAQEFYAWHKDFVIFLKSLLSGEATQRRLLTEALGAKAVNSAFARQADSLKQARQHGILKLDSSAGLGLTTGVIVSPRHTIHGEP